MGTVGALWRGQAEGESGAKSLRALQTREIFFNFFSFFMLMDCKKEEKKHKLKKKKLLND